MANHVYVVELLTGEYDDATKYPMCAFYLEEDALNHVNKINAALKKENLFWNECTGSGPFTYDEVEYYLSYTGAEAQYYSIEMRGM